jgi:transcription antitermination factor NusG
VVLSTGLQLRGAWRQNTSLIEDGEALSCGSSVGVGPESLGCAQQTGFSAATERERWFAAYITPRHEKAVARQFGLRDLEAFLPLYTSIRRWKNGCHVAVEQPLFPGYVFVNLPRRSWVEVLQVPGVISIVSRGRQPAALPSSEVESLRAGLPRRQFEPHAYLAAGDKVRIVEGPFAGMAGVLLRKKNHFRVVLTLDLIMQSVAVEVGVDEIEPLRK